MQKRVISLFIGILFLLQNVVTIYSIDFNELLTEDKSSTIHNLSSIHIPVEESNFDALIDINYLYINGNDDLLEKASQNDWPGHGYEWDPILIQGYHFRNSVHLFVVDNTDLYWEFSNNVLDGIDDRYCIIVIGNVKNCRISNNLFLAGAVGIHSIRVHDCSFVGNVFYNQSWDGILLENSYKNIILANTFHNLGEGGILAWENSFGNNIMYNVIYDNPYGVLLWSGSDDNLIQHNRMHDLSLCGIDVQTSDNRVIYNEIQMVTGDAISLTAPIAEISNNLIHNNTGVGVRISSSSGEVTINHNVFIRNDKGGIQLSDSSDNSIERNDFYENSKDQAWDSGNENYFAFNYWHEWIGNDTDDNEIIDTPKQIVGSAGNEDRTPTRSPNNLIPSWYNFEPITGPPTNPEPTETTTTTTMSSPTSTLPPSTSATTSNRTTDAQASLLLMIASISGASILIIAVISIVKMKRNDT